MILLIDSYDSFSYNLYQLVGEIEPDIRVIRNDEFTVEEIEKMNPRPKCDCYAKFAAKVTIAVEFLGDMEEQNETDLV